MDYLREGIHLRGFAQIDPLVAYKNEGFTMFEELMHSIWEEFARLIFHVEVEVAPARPRSSSRRRGRPAASTTRAAPPSSPRPSARRPSRPRPGADAAAEQAIAGNAQPRQRRRRQSPSRRRSSRTTSDKIGRNDPCWCGSGKKYKKCHGA